MNIITKHIKCDVPDNLVVENKRLRLLSLKRTDSATLTQSLRCYDAPSANSVGDVFYSFVFPNGTSYDFTMDNFVFQNGLVVRGIDEFPLAWFLITYELLENE